MTLGAFSRTGECPLIQILSAVDRSEATLG